MISSGDAGGNGGLPTENSENVQNAHLILVADDEILTRTPHQSVTTHVAVRSVQACCELHALERNTPDVCSACGEGTDHDSGRVEPSSGYA